MARRTTRKTTRRTRPATRRPRARRRPFELRWFHLLIGCVSAFALGYLVAAAQITSYASAMLAGG
jgi:hypothetical protein